MALVEFSPELSLLQSTAAKFIESTLPLGEVRRRIDDQGVLGGDYLTKAASIGWFAAFVPEEYSGGAASGSPIVDAAVIAEQRGRGLQPGPFVGTHVVAHALARAGSDRQRSTVLPALAGGDQAAAWVFPEPDSNSIGKFGVRATRSREGWEIDRQAVVTHEAALADWLLVTAEIEGLIEQFVVPVTAAGVRIRALRGLDLSTGSSTVEFEHLVLAEEDRLTGGVEPDLLCREQLDLAALLTTVDSVGAMDRLLEMTVGYSLERRAFDRQIGSFQAIKHQLADLSMLLVSSKMLVRCAIEAVSAGTEDTTEIVSMAKALVSDTGFDLAQGCLQVHGGIGYAWEHDLHLFLRRLAGDSARYGDAAFHRERILREHDL